MCCLVVSLGHPRETTCQDRYRVLTNVILPLRVPPFRALNVVLWLFREYMELCISINEGTVHWTSVQLRIVLHEETEEKTGWCACLVLQEGEFSHVVHFFKENFMQNTNGCQENVCYFGFRNTISLAEFSRRVGHQHWNIEQKGFQCDDAHEHPWFSCGTIWPSLLQPCSRARPLGLPGSL